MDQSNISISRKGLIQVIIPLLLGTSILLALSFLLFQAESELDREARARTTLAALTDLGKGIPEAISAVTTYAYFGGSEYKVRYEQIVKRVDGSYNQLNHLYKDKQKRLAELKHLHQLEFGVFEILNVIVSATDRSETSELLRIESMRWQLESSGKQFLRELNEFTETEKVSQKPTDARVFRDSMKALLLFGVLVNVGVSLWLANVFSHGITKRLLNVLNNSNRLANKETLLPQMTGTDEIAALDTAFHKMAAALEEAARRERAIIDNAADVICSLSKDQRFVSVSPASSKIWGYSPSELTGKHLSEIVVGDDIAVVTRALEESLETKQSTTFDTRIKHQSGAILHSLWSMEWSEEQETFFCVTHDYTKRKMAEDLLRESEATIRLIIESLPVSLMVLDQDGYIHQSNRTTERMFTLTKDMLNTSNVVDLIPAAASLEEKCLGQVSELEAVRRGGKPFPIELSLSEIYLKGERRLVAVSQDITERHQLERMRRELMAMVSHDLRTPLTVVLGTLGLLAEGLLGELNEMGVKKVASCEKEVERLMQMINDLLNIEKIEAGRMEMALEVVLLETIAARAVDSVSYLAEKNGLRIVQDLESCETIADGPKLLQVVINLLSNAIKFSPKGSTIRVTTRRNAEMAEVAVEDRGRGVPADMREAVFEKFRQVERSDQSVLGGSGLGLPICKSIVEAHKGKIGVDSEEGKGSTFWFRIPIPDLPDDDENMDCS